VVEIDGSSRRSYFAKNGVDVVMTETQRPQSVADHIERSDVDASATSG
jgi:hypothetical protein